MADFVKVATRKDLNPGEGRRVEINGQEIALFNCNGEFFALDAVCPHSGGPLADGFVDGETVVCPWHGWEFNIKSGACRYGVNQRTFPVKIVGDDILVSTEATPAPPPAPEEKEEETKPEAGEEDLTFTRVAVVGEIGEGQAKMVEVDGQQIALFNLAGQYYAIDEVCPHMGGPLSEGAVEKDCVICPWHGWEFNIKTGASPTGVDQRKFPVKVQQDGIYVAVPQKS